MKKKIVVLLALAFMATGMSSCYVENGHHHMWWHRHHHHHDMH